MKSKSNQRSESGITLIALIITIIVLVILAAVSISAVYNSKVINYAIDGATGYAEEGVRENKIMSGTESLVDSTVKRIEDILGGKISSGGETPTPPTPEEPKGPNGKTLVTVLTEIQLAEVKAEDKLGNSITVPKGFKYKEGGIVEKGIVIEDGDGNQFVWVPVSNINHDGTNKIKKEDGTDVEITLGRYTFDDTTGAVKTTSGSYQYAVNYADETIVDTYYKELKDYKASDGTTTNTTAKNLKGFIDSTNVNKGYYIARYEASHGSGNSVTNWKPLSKVSTKTSGDKPLALWIHVTQPDAAKICQNMYSSNVNSDLLNSYAWDTAIIFIQEMEDNDYSIKKYGKGTLKNTGETGDKVCNIFDMGGNLWEWTTELSLQILNGNARPCVARGGGYYDNNVYSSVRGRYDATYAVGDIGFRVILYI